MKTKTSAGFVLFRTHEGSCKYLLLKSARDGLYGFPKGHIDEDEKLLETAYRELMEETGIADIRVVDGFQKSISYEIVRKETFLKTAHYFLAECFSGNVLLSPEHAEFHWAGFEEALELVNFDQLREVLRCARDYLADGS
ncbi:MAG: NUDIX domain-containing protein [Planctomycetes bacterium]|nr:NUDIX domain-containing protein [Planctomycetota bacterium]